MKRFLVVFMVVALMSSMVSISVSAGSGLDYQFCDFETSVGGWSASQGCSVSRSNGGAGGTQGALCFTQSRVGQKGISQSFYLVEGESYQISFFVRTDVPTTGNVTIAVENGQGVNGTAAIYTTDTKAGEEWEYVSYRYKHTGASGGIKFTFYPSAASYDASYFQNGATLKFYFDDFRIKRYLEGVDEQESAELRWDFSNGTTGGWTEPGGAGKISYEAETGCDGEIGVLVYNGGGLKFNWDRAAGISQSFQKGVTYELTAWIKIADTAGHALPAKPVTFAVGDGGSNRIPTKVYANETWQECTATFTPTTDLEDVWFYIYPAQSGWPTEESSKSTVIYYDNISIIPQQESGTNEETGLGTENFESNTGNWKINTATALTRTSKTFLNGKYGLAVKVSSEEEMPVRENIQMEADTEYLISTWYKTDKQLSNLTGMKFTVEYYDESDLVIGTDAVVVSYPPSNVWRKIGVTVHSPKEKAAYAKLYPSLLGCNKGMYYYMDDFDISEVPESVPIHNGEIQYDCSAYQGQKYRIMRTFLGEQSGNYVTVQSGTAGSSLYYQIGEAEQESLFQVVFVDGAKEQILTTTLFSVEVECEKNAFPSGTAISNGVIVTNPTEDMMTLDVFCGEYTKKGGLLTDLQGSFAEELPPHCGMVKNFQKINDESYAQIYVWDTQTKKPYLK